MMRLHSNSNPWIDRKRLPFIYLASHKSTFLQYIIHRLDNLYIRIKIDSTILIKHPKTSIITHKSIFLGYISLTCIRDNIYIKIILIPLPYLIVWKIFLPTLNTFLCRFWQRTSPKPTIMNYSRYHLYLYIEVYSKC